MPERLAALREEFSSGKPVVPKVEGMLLCTRLRGTRQAPAMLTENQRANAGGAGAGLRTGAVGARAKAVDTGSSQVKRERNLPAGNWAPYVRWCIRRGLWLRGAAVAVSVAGCIFFAVALWLATQDRAILGIDSFRGALGLVAQVGVTVFLALELAVARREYREV